MQGQLLLGLQALHFLIQTLDKVASGGGLSRVPETIQMGPVHVLPQRTPPRFSKGKVHEQDLNLEQLQWQIPSDGLDLNN